MAEKRRRVNPHRALVSQAVRELDGLRRRYERARDRLVDQHGPDVYYDKFSGRLEKEYRGHQRDWMTRWQHYFNDIIKELRDVISTAPGWFGRSPGQDHVRGKHYGAKVGRGQGQAKGRPG